MSKNLTRKGLALGALVALGSSVIAGAPAQAAGELVVAPSAGTSYNTFVTDTYNLVTTFAPGYTPSSYAQLKYQIKVDANAASTIQATSGVAAQVKATVDAATPFSGNTNNTYVLASTGAGATTVNYLGINVDAATSASTTTSVEVTAFVDANNDGALSAGEWNTVKTVTFKKYSEVSPTVTVTAPSEADTTVKATVNYGDLNVEQQTAADYKVVFSGFGTPTAGGVAASSGVYSDTVTVPASGTLSAQATYKTVAVGTAGTAAVTGRSITDLATTGAATVVSVDANASNNARTNKAFSVDVLVKDTATTPVAKAGVAVTAAITSSVTWVSTDNKTLTVNGTSYNASANLPTAVAVTTGTDGKARVTLTPAGFAEGNTFTITFKAQNYTVAKTVTLQDARFTITADDSASTYRKVAPKGSITVKYGIKDQYGVAISGAARLAAALTGTGTGFTTQYVNITDGSASVTYTDPSGSTGATDTATVTLQSQDPSNLNWDTLDNDSTTASVQAATKALTLTLSSAADSFQTAPSATYSGTVTTDDAYTLAGNGAVTVAVRGTVAGSTLTVAATGLAFEVGGVLFKDKATFFDTGASQNVLVYSTKSGEQTVAFTNGSATASTKITFAAGASASVVWALPAQAQAGQAVDVVFTVVDKHGNTVGSIAAPAGGNAGGLTISSTGVGYLATTGAVALTSGKFTTKLITGSSDLGTANISATLDLATDVVKTTAIEFGQSDVTDISSAGKAIYVNTEFAKGKVVTVYIDGKRMPVKSAEATDNAVERKYTQKKAGKHVVTVRISGGIVASETVVTTK